MMTIEEEVEHLFTFLSHPAGFDVDMGGILCIRPVDEGSPPTHWEVDWEDDMDGVRAECFKEFDNLRDACQFFVEKRHYMCNGLDFDAIAWEEVKRSQAKVEMD